MKNTKRLIASVSVVAALGVACGNDDDNDSASGATTTTEQGSSSTTAGDSADSTSAPDVDVVEVTIRDFEFDPESLRVPAGTAVRFMNEDSATHTVTAGTPDAPTPELFDESLAEGDSTEITFDEPGRQPYFCEIHPSSMTGEVIVE